MKCDFYELKDYLEKTGALQRPAEEKKVAVVAFGEAPEDFFDKTVPTDWYAVTCDRKVRERLPQIIDRFKGYIFRVIVQEASGYMYIQVKHGNDFRVAQWEENRIKREAFNTNEQNFKSYFRFRRPVKYDEIKNVVESAVAM